MPRSQHLHVNCSYDSIRESTASFICRCASCTADTRNPGTTVRADDEGCARKQAHGGRNAILIIFRTHSCTAVVVVCSAKKQTAADISSINSTDCPRNTGYYRLILVCIAHTIYIFRYDMYLQYQCRLYVHTVVQNVFYVTTHIFFMCTSALRGIEEDSCKCHTQYQQCFLVLQNACISCAI